MGKKTVQVEEIFEFSNWKYCCGKFYDSLIPSYLSTLASTADIG
jgi:hypothetical protein